MRIALLTIFVFLTGCAAVPPQAPWFEGHFTASYADARSTSDFAIACSAVPDCETTIEELTPRKTAPQKIVSKGARRVDLDVLNNTLQAVRAAVVVTPKLYEHTNDGPLLRRLRPLLESSSKFTECLGVAPDGGDSIALCRLGSGAQAAPVLLFSTMKPACADNSAFCAYYLLPLARHQ
nr:hypothetical protein [Rhodoferax sp.]